MMWYGSSLGCSSCQLERVVRSCWLARPFQLLPCDQSMATAALEFRRSVHCWRLSTRGSGPDSSEDSGSSGCGSVLLVDGAARIIADWCMSGSTTLKIGVTSSAGLLAASTPLCLMAGSLVMVFGTRKMAPCRGTEESPLIRDIPFTCCEIT